MIIIISVIIINNKHGNNNHELYIVYKVSEQDFSDNLSLIGKVTTS